MVFIQKNYIDGFQIMEDGGKGLTFLGKRKTWNEAEDYARSFPNYNPLCNS